MNVLRTSRIVGGLCFGVGLLDALGALHAGTPVEWLLAGLIALCAGEVVAS